MWSKRGCNQSAERVNGKVPCLFKCIAALCSSINKRKCQSCVGNSRRDFGKTTRTFVRDAERGKRVRSGFGCCFGELRFDEFLGELVQVALRRQAVHRDDSRNTRRLGPALGSDFIRLFDELCFLWTGFGSAGVRVVSRRTRSEFCQQYVLYSWGLE